ncbi:MAG: hypothetical protein WBV93_10305 [Anaerobacillus sp.]
MKFNYDYFTGSISEATFVDLLATKIKSELNPLSTVYQIESALHRIVNTFIGTTDGFQWADLAKYLGDLALGIAELIPGVKYAEAIGLLWTASKLA